jgi:hypothetical protein
MLVDADGGIHTYGSSDVDSGDDWIAVKGC